MSDSPSSRLWLVPILGLLAITFTICTAELVIAGLLPTLAADLGVDIPTAGLLITGYAIGVALFGPLLALATSNVPRKTLLLAIVAVFILGNILCALSPNYWLLLGARILMSACHGLYFGVAVVLAGRLAPAGRQATAVSLVTAGVTLAIILGVPLGTAIGNSLGWRMTFWITAAAGALAALLVAWLIPAAAGRSNGPAPDRRAELRNAVRPVVLLSYVNFGVPLVAFFALLSYAVPFMTEESGIPLDLVPLILLLLGVAAFLGTLLGGRLGDWNASATLIGITATNALLFLLLSQMAGIGWASVLLLCLIWFVGFMMPPPLQSRVLREASEAPNLAATLMNTASQIGIAGGAAYGAFLLSQGLDYRQIPLFSTAFYVLGLVGILILVAHDRRQKAPGP